jgi:hypothetical protein
VPQFVVRLRGTVLVAVALVATAAGPAAAGDPFANYVTEVTGIKPALPGVTATAPRDGADIEVTNTTATPLIVLGYQGEPYLKITDHGVWQNQLSPATYLNREYSIDSIPGSVDTHKAPEWKNLSDGSTARWHDHRIHWMGAVEPPDVAGDKGHPHLIKSWQIGLEYGTRKADIDGTLSWQPTSPWGLYLTYGGLAAAVVAALVVAIAFRRQSVER